MWLIFSADNLRLAAMQDTTEGILIRSTVTGKVKLTVDYSKAILWRRLWQDPLGRTLCST